MIVLFSGNGNTAYVASMLAERLGEKICRIEDAREVDMSGCSRVIWCLPVYAWGVPLIVRRCIDEMICGSDTEHYLVCSCGDDIGNADKQWRKLIDGRGGKACGAYSVQMPNTYVNLPGFDVDSDAVAEGKVEAAPRRVAEIARRIAAGEWGGDDDVVRGALPWLKTGAFYPFFMRFLSSTKPFGVSDVCISCGKCARMCPMSVIEMKQGRPEWHRGKCTMCMRCYHHCPTHAIRYGRNTIKKGQFYISEGREASLSHPNDD